MQYTSQELVESFLGRTLSDGESNLLSTIVKGVERQIDEELDTTFSNDSSLYGAIRYFDGGFRHIDIDPCQNITDITLVNPARDAFSTLESDLYLLRPTNSPVSTLIDFRFGRIPRGYGNLRVTADFTEYGAEEGGVPSDIKTVATRVVGAMLMSPEMAVGIQQESVEGHSVTYQQNFQGEIQGMFSKDPIVRSLMDSRRRPLIDDIPILTDIDDDDNYYLGNY